MLALPTLTPTDTWAAAAAFLAAAGLLMRRHMLKPSLATWAAGPPAVRAVLSLTATVIALAGVSVVGGPHASAREASVLTAVAIMAWVMVANLHLTGRASPREAASAEA